MDWVQVLKPKTLYTRPSTLYHWHNNYEQYFLLHKLEGKIELHLKPIYI